MANSTKSAAKSAPAAPEGPKAPEAGAEQKRLDEQQAAADDKAEAKAETADKTAALADAQRQDIEAGGNGQEQADEAAKLRAEAGATDAGLTATGHTIADPKAAPVNLSGDSLRRPNQRVLSPEHMESSGMGAPVVSLPYGSEPRSVDPATGVAPAKPADPDADVHGADTDADTDRGSSAAMRSQKAGEAA